MRATVSALAQPIAKRPSRFANSPPLPLDFFINRAASLSLYRHFIRASRSLGDLTARWETVEWVRADFERYRGVVESLRALSRALSRILEHSSVARDRLVPLLSPTPSSWQLCTPRTQQRALGSTAVRSENGDGPLSRFLYGSPALSSSTSQLPSPSSPSSTSASSSPHSNPLSRLAIAENSPTPAPAPRSLLTSWFPRRKKRPPLPTASSSYLDEERLSKERNQETVKALERMLRNTRGSGYGTGGGTGGTMEVRATTLDFKGTVTTTSVALSKPALCSKFGIPPRDLRKLDSGVPTVVPTILSRKSCILLTMLHLRVAITAREVTIFDSVGSEDSWLKGVFVWSLEHALKTPAKAAHGLPYEFRALEACLVSVLTALETDLGNIRSHVVELLGHMEEHIDRENLRLLLSYSRRLTVFQKRATLVQECLEELLANDADLASMYLTSKLQNKPRTLEDHEEIELLLESFSKQCEEIVSEVETLSANVRHTEDIIELILDSNRNSLLGLDLKVSIATLGLTAGALLAALFGMLTTYLETTPWAFPFVTLSSFLIASGATLYGLRHLNRIRKVNLGWREEVRLAGERWKRGERVRRPARRRD
ncbi:hypothetical protein JCM11641_006313 [Rhodosporidiobolus odoratus]